MFTILGVPFDAPYEMIDKAYKRLIVLYHPDRNPGDEEAARRYQLIDMAYSVLSDPNKRVRYSRTGVYDGQEAVNTEWMRTAEILSELLRQAVEQLTEKGDKITELNLTQVMTKSLAENIKANKKELTIIRKGIENYKSLHGRFEIKAGEKNMLEGMLAFRIRCEEQRAEDQERIIKEHQAALEHLKLYKFKFDKPKDPYGFGSMPPVWSSAMTWKMPPLKHKDDEDDGD